MTSEIRTNTITSRAGLSTVTFTDSGPMFSGITTFVDNSTFSVGTGGTIHAPATNVMALGTNSIDAIKIDSSGNVNVTGILTASSISGGVSLANGANDRVVTATGAAALTGETYFTWNGNNLALRGGQNQNCTIELASDEGDSAADFWRVMAQNSDNALAIDHYATGSWVEQLRITSGGTVHTAMTGTAPSWLGNTIATREKFSVFQGANFSEACFNIDVDNANSFLSHNMYYSSGWKIKKSGQPVRHLEIGTNGWSFMTGADGSDDTASALTNKFRIRPSGRIQIANNDEDIDMSGDSAGQIQIDGNGYTGAIALNSQGMFLYHNSNTRYIGIGVNETEVGRFSTGGYEQRFSNTSTYSTTTGSRKGIYVFNSGATTNCYASLELGANNSNGHFGSTILNSIATADTSYSNHFGIQLRHGGNYYERLRIKSEGDVSIPDGNLIVASGHGINFSATSDGSGSTTQSELFNDYERGTWTPSMNKSGATGSADSQVSNRFGFYVKCGDLLWISFYWYSNNLSFGTGGNNWYIDNLPYNLLTLASSAYQFIPGGYLYTNSHPSAYSAGYRWQSNSTNGADTLYMYGTNGNTNATGGAWEFSGCGTLRVSS